MIKITRTKKQEPKKNQITKTKLQKTHVKGSAFSDLKFVLIIWFLRFVIWNF